MTQEEKSKYWSDRINQTNDWLENNADKYYVSEGIIYLHSADEVPSIVLEEIKSRNELSEKELEDFCQKINELF